MLKELIYTSLGATSLIKDKIEEELKILEEKGKLNSSDIKTFIDSLEKKGKAQDEKFKEDLKNSLKEIIKELGLATKEDLEKFKKELK
ncbi:hypothetical protein [Malaciobacter mytili]|uniref:Polyhydroxyalkanoate synthesis regulator phasin n=1 Tax=Malaciobacter mytili LMG 24559 TaxID=1032238 RepID=A0AAX2AH87_9BACT|nr:hypothetical protein [Malaciobacter mytili]AXH14925.1 hypothetical protein AMYT_1344 [Malaciobacter mytili LMG 24559]RXK14861.1 hypothetical protein CP985_11495 [Malaciobacter mytili LMG 24559]